MMVYSCVSPQSAQPFVDSCGTAWHHPSWRSWPWISSDPHPAAAAIARSVRCSRPVARSPYPSHRCNHNASICFYWCPGRDSNSHDLRSTDFKSVASTNSATRAGFPTCYMEARDGIENRPESPYLRHFWVTQPVSYPRNYLNCSAPGIGRRSLSATQQPLQNSLRSNLGRCTHPDSLEKPSED